MEFYWNEDKNNHLKNTIDVSFEMVRDEVLAGRVLAELPNRNRSNHRIYVVLLNGYVCAVPFVRKGNAVFLKTIFQDRVLNALHGVSHGKTK